MKFLYLQELTRNSAAEVDRKSTALGQEILEMSSLHEHNEIVDRILRNDFLEGAIVHISVLVIVH